MTLFACTYGDGLDSTALTREGEVEIAKRIEEAQNQILMAVIRTHWRPRKCSTFARSSTMASSVWMSLMSPPVRRR